MAGGNVPEFRPLDALSVMDASHALERNGYLQAAEDLRAGKTLLDATRYVVACQPPYNDADGWRLQHYIDEIHESHRTDTPGGSSVGPKRDEGPER